MSNNLFICCSQLDPDAASGRLDAAIRALGPSVAVSSHLWYVKSALGLAEVVQRIRAAAADRDRFVVVDATNNSADWSGTSEEVVRFVREQWYR